MSSILLLVITGSRVHRFCGTRCIEKADIDPQTPIQHLREQLEQFRMHGMPEDEKLWEPAPRNPGRAAFDRIARGLESIEDDWRAFGIRIRYDAISAGDRPRTHRWLSQDQWAKQGHDGVVA